MAESERYVTWNIDLTRTTFKQSFQQAIGTYGDRLRAVVATFVIFKQANGPQPWPHATADKASGFDPTNGRIRYKPYADNNIWHCHCDLQGADPLIAYQIRPAERRIIVLAITDHAEMFGNARRQFAQSVLKQ